MVDLRLMFCGVKQVSDSRENSFAETRANVRKTFHVTGHGVPNIGKQPFDAYISRHGFAMEMYNLKFFCFGNLAHVKDNYCLERVRKFPGSARLWRAVVGVPPTISSAFLLGRNCSFFILHAGASRRDAAKS